MSYIYLGSIKRGIDRGLLLNRAIERLDDTPSQHRREALLDRVKVAEVVDMMGLTDLVGSVFLLNKSQYEQNPDLAHTVLLKSLLDMLVQRYPELAPAALARESGPAARTTAAPVAPAVEPPPVPPVPPPAAEPPPLATPVAPTASDGGYSPERGAPAQSGAGSAPEPAARKTPLSGMMKLRR